MDFGFSLQSHSARIKKYKLKIEFEERNPNYQSLTKEAIYRRTC